MRSIFLPSLAITMAMALAPDVARAQDAPPQQVFSEHRYQFALSGELSIYTEKLLVESLLGFDPNMRIAIDRTAQSMKVLAYVPVDPQAMVSLATQFGVTIVPRRLVMEHDGTYSIQD